MSKDSEDLRIEAIRRKVLGGEDAAPIFVDRIDPRSREIIQPEPCPKCGSDFVDPWAQVIDGQPARGLKCEDCSYFWVPKKD